MNKIVHNKLIEFKLVESYFQALIYHRPLSLNIVSRILWTLFVHSCSILLVCQTCSIQSIWKKHANCTSSQSLLKLKKFLQYSLYWNFQLFETYRFYLINPFQIRGKSFRSSHLKSGKYNRKCICYNFLVSLLLNSLHSSQ